MGILVGLRVVGRGTRFGYWAQELQACVVEMPGLGREAPSCLL